MTDNDFTRDTSNEKEEQRAFILSLQTNLKQTLEMICQAIEYHAVGVHINGGDFKCAGKNLAQIWLQFETNQQHRTWYDYELRRIAEQIHSRNLVVSEREGVIRISYGYRVGMPDEMTIEGSGIRVKKVFV